MSSQSQISTRLSADNSDYRSVINQTIQVTDQGAKAILQKLNIRAGVAAIAAAIGVNMQSIVEGIARFYTGMSKELEATFKRIENLTDRVRDATIASIRSQASEEVKYQLLLQERERILQRLEKGRPEGESTKFSVVGLIKSIPSIGGLPNPFYDSQKTLIAEAQANNFEAREREKARLIELDTEINKIEEKRTAEIEKQNARLSDQTTVKTEAVKVAETHLAVEKQITAEQQKQLDQLNEAAARSSLADQLLNSELIVGGRRFGPSIDPRLIEEATTAQLKEVIRRAIADIQFVEMNKGASAPDIVSGFLTQNAIIDRLRTDINRAQYQIDLRSGVQRDIAFRGEDYARRRFAGSPLEFDQVLSRFVNPGPFNEQTSLLRKISDRLEQPLRTVATSPSPFGAG